MHQIKNFKCTAITRRKRRFGLLRKLTHITTCNMLILIIIKGQMLHNLLRWMTHPLVPHIHANTVYKAFIHNSTDTRNQIATSINSLYSERLCIKHIKMLFHFTHNNDLVSLQVLQDAKIWVECKFQGISL